MLLSIFSSFCTHVIEKLFNSGYCTSLPNSTICDVSSVTWNRPGEYMHTQNVSKYYKSGQHSNPQPQELVVKYLYRHYLVRIKGTALNINYSTVQFSCELLIVNYSRQIVKCF